MPAHRIPNGWSPQAFPPVDSAPVAGPGGETVIGPAVEVRRIRRVCLPKFDLSGVCFFGTVLL